jgi:segregation and condensation protein B
VSSEPDEVEQAGQAAPAPAGLQAPELDPAGLDPAGDPAELDPGLPEPEPDSGELDPDELVSALEAVLFVVDAPVTVAALAAALQQPTAGVEHALERLRASYDERNAGIEVREVAGGVRVFTRPAHARHVEAFLQDGQRTRLSQAALETLAVIAYRQPVTRGRVSAIRGVNVDGVVRTLLSRGLIVEVGSDPETGGGLYRTTELFLERMGLQTLDELPSLAPLLPEVDGLEYDDGL